MNYRLNYVNVAKHFDGWCATQTHLLY